MLKIQNKTQKGFSKSYLRVYFKFEQPIPKDRSELSGALVFSSGEEEHEDLVENKKDLSPLKKVERYPTQADKSPDKF